MVKNASDRRQGFTLLELAIVLVIVGLIVGGILVGQDLIKAAEVRSTISQIEKYNTAANTFIGKYRAVPGDMFQAEAGQFGLFQLTNAAVSGQGDGNGRIEGGGTGITDPQGETLVFWRHLSEANLIDGALGSSGNSAIVAATGLVTGVVTSLAQSLPGTKLTPTNSIVVYSAGSYNFFQMIPVATITAVPSYTFNTTGISPLHAFSMDVKIDDGQPNTGIVIARGLAAVNATASWVAVSTPATCLSGGASATDVTDDYNRVLASGGNDPSCSVRFRFN